MRLERFITGFYFLSLVLLISCAKKDVKQEPVAVTEVRETGSVQSRPESPLRTVYFDFDSSRLSNNSKNTLKENAQWLKQNPTASVRVEGHCDERGSNRYNEQLGKRRASAVRDFLVKNGIKRSRITVVSYGESQPADLGHDEEAWAKNRRVESVPSSSYALLSP